MPLNIKNLEFERLAKEVAALSNETKDGSYPAGTGGTSASAAGSERQAW